MELHTLIQNIRQIELLCKSMTQQKLSGLFNSSFRGAGVALDAIRKYESGDDVRSINWNVTARLQEPYVNIFTEDKERLIWIVLDVSGSGVFGTQKKSKYDLAVEIAATLAFGALENNDRVGVIFFSDKIEKLIQPARGMANFWRIAKEMISFKPQSNSTDLAKTLHFLMNLSKQRSVIFLLSDFISADYQSSAKVLANQHEVIAIQVYDERERALPKIGWVRQQCAETGKIKWVNTSSEKYQQNYSKQFEQIQHYFQDTFGYGTSDCLSVSTADNYVGQLVHFMSSRI